MSGHSKWSTIKRQKGANDAARGKLFSKLSRLITIAAKTGGPDIDSNPRLRAAVDAARNANMPKDNIERAILKSTGGADNMEEVVYEGFGPNGIGIIIEVATDNKNRTAQEIKNILDRSGGSMGGPNSVAFNFENKGLLVVEKSSDPDNQMLTLIDKGVEDIEDSGENFEAYVAPQSLYETKSEVEAIGLKVLNAELVKKPINLIAISDLKLANKIVDLLDTLEGHDDVQQVWSNVDISDNIATN